jgi:hypothetical protein
LFVSFVETLHTFPQGVQGSFDADETSPTFVEVDDEQHPVTNRLQGVRVEDMETVSQIDEPISCGSPPNLEISEKQ